MTSFTASAPRNEKIGAAALILATMVALGWGLVDTLPSFAGSQAASAPAEGRSISAPAAAAVLNLGGQHDMG
jgi:hypothetical protein